MNLKKLVPIESNNRRVLTTAQIAEAYGTTTQIITRNFNCNKERYQEGKHYYLLKGALLQAFRTKSQIDFLPSNVGKLYLWTESGALLHAKSLNTDKGWDVYMFLVDSYFRKEFRMEKLHKKLAAVKEDVIKIQDKTINYLTDKVISLEISATISAAEQDKLKALAHEVVADFLGENTVSYRVLARSAFWQLWNDYREKFSLNTYRDTPKYLYKKGYDFIDKWGPEDWILEKSEELEDDFLEYMESQFDDYDNDGYKRLLTDCPFILEDYIITKN